MEGTTVGSQSSFSDIPLNREVKIIGIQYVSDQAFLTVGKTNTSKNDYSLSGFEKFTLSELREEINNVN